MRNEKICVSKKLLIILCICIGITALVLVSRYLGSNKLGTQSKAAPPNKPLTIFCGQDIEKDEFPFVGQVKIYFDKPNEPTKTHVNMGTGTLINPEWVLTGAHLYSDIEEKDETAFWVAVNIINTDEFDNKKLKGKAFFGHKNYVEGTKKQTADNDIALIKLDKKINGIALPRIPDDESAYQEGSEVTLIGAGAVDEEILNVSIKGDTATVKSKDIEIPPLQKVNIAIINPTIGPSGFPVKNMEFFMDAGENSPCVKTAWHGDSGGPVVSKINDEYLLLGIIQGNDPTRNFPSGKLASASTFATKTSYFREWIKEVIELNDTDCTYNGHDVVTKSAFDKLKEIVQIPPLYYSDGLGIIHDAKTNTSLGKRCKALGEANWSLGIEDLR